jgi:N-methylhydantoinase A/oxoprolinase/acetone carboxylase beta subunit
MSGMLVAGPAVIEQMDTTIPLYPGDSARVLQNGSLLIDVQSAS